jgi:dTDP-4-amino-4,6-dideoxygalactose transaminase
MIHLCEHDISLGDVNAVANAMSGRLSHGEHVKEFEAAVCERVGASHAVAVSSGTAALFLSLQVLQPSLIGIPRVTFPSILHASYVLKIPHVILNVNQNGVCEGRTGRNITYIPTHIGGALAALEWGMDTIEDACHAFGATHPDGLPVGSDATKKMVTCFSFHPSKSITTGEGGMICTRDEEVARELRLYRDIGRDYASDNPYTFVRSLALNFRMPELSAALGLSQLKRLDEFLEKRRELVRVYREQLKAIGVQYQEFDLEASSCHLMVVFVDGRDAVRKALEAQGIETAIHYPPLIPVVGMLALNPYWDRCVSLPLHVHMTKMDVKTVVSALERALCA